MEVQLWHLTDLSFQISKRTKRKNIKRKNYKIYQPEADEITLVIKQNRENLRLHLSASPSLPIVYLSNQGKQNPIQAPNFCMLLRKHLGSGRIISVEQPGYERILRSQWNIWTNWEMSAKRN